MSPNYLNETLLMVLTIGDTVTYLTQKYLIDQVGYFQKFQRVGNRIWNLFALTTRVYIMALIVWEVKPTLRIHFYFLYGIVPAFLKGGEREPNGDYAKAFTLKRINYPTGGNTSFDYEGNTYSFVYSSTRYGYTDESNCGGIRVKSIADSPDGISFNTKAFSYDRGVLYGEPLFLQPVFENRIYDGQIQSSFFECGWHPHPLPNLGPNFLVEPAIGGYNLYSNSIEPLSIFGSDNIGYSFVTESSSTGSITFSYTSGFGVGNVELNPASAG
jgi:hypothetical protein